MLGAAHGEFFFFGVRLRAFVRYSKNSVCGLTGECEGFEGERVMRLFLLQGELCDATIHCLEEGC